MTFFYSLFFQIPILLDFASFLLFAYFFLLVPVLAIKLPAVLFKTIIAITLKSTFNSTIK